MKHFKLYILLFFVRHRINRWFRSNNPSKSMIHKWEENLKKSSFYNNSSLPYPIVNKQLFMANFDAINTVNITKKEAFKVALKSETTRDFNPDIGNISVGLSSGTSGNKGLFLVSPKERAMWVGAILDRVIGFSFKKRKVAFFLRANNNLYESVKSKIITFHFFDIIKSIDDHIIELVKVKPNILIAQPSVLNEIAKRFEEKEIFLKFDKIISVAEVLEEDQKKYFEKVFLQKIEQVYQATEGFLAHTCKEGKLHFNEDWLKIEKKYIDENKIRFHPIITDYMRLSQPLIRYELNDIIHEGKPCKCGLKSTVIDEIEGRSDDVFTFEVADEKIIIFPDFIRRAVINSSDGILNYKVTLTSNNTIIYALEVNKKTNKKETSEKVKSALLNLFNQKNIKNMVINEGTIEINAMNKFKRISNESNKTI